MGELTIKNVSHKTENKNTIKSFGGLSDFDEVNSFELGVTRDGSVKTETHQTKGGEIGVVELNDGTVLYLEPEYAAEISRLQEDGSTRGVFKLITKVVRFFAPKKDDKDIVEKVQDKLSVGVVDYLEKKLEDTLKRPEGLYVCGWSPIPEDNGLPSFDIDDVQTEFLDVDLKFGLSVNAVNNEDISLEKPNFIFIHGTASSTNGSFGGLGRLENREYIKELRKQYKEQIFAFQHRTLSVSPITNAINLLQQLPSNATIHLVTHSRGGLVGEILCLASAEGEPINLEEAKDIFTRDKNEGLTEFEKEELKQLKELNQLLKEKRPKVERFVRSGCPSRGTTLASKRLDMYFSVSLDLLSNVPIFDNPVFEFLQTVVLKTVSLKTNPEELPGLEAQMPTSPLINLLNTDPREVSADLAVLAGDIKLGGILKVKQNLLTILGNLYFRSKNDLVVDTKYMFGGSQRYASYYFFEEGSDVTHFSYFSRPSSVRRIVAALGTREDDPRWEDERFRVISKEVQAGIDPSIRARSDQPKPVIFVLPGIMGSHLSLKDDTIWLDVFSLARGGLGEIHMDAIGVEASKLLQRSYGDLIDFLAETHEVIPFPYDWRRPIQEESRRLAGAIESRLNELDQNQNEHWKEQPVQIIAHSMGGLVARSLCFEAPEVWKKLSNKDGFRLIMLGTPNGGSYSIVRTLFGHNKLINYLATLDFKHSKKEIIEIISKFQGVSDLLPQSESGDWVDAAFWHNVLNEAKQEENATSPTDHVLQKTKGFQELLGQHPVHKQAEPGKIVYVAGLADRTPIAHQVKDGEIEFIATERGDGSVPWDTGIPERIPVWYSESEHGNLANDQESFSALLELLNTGSTQRLSTTPPDTASRGSLPNFARDEDDSGFPDSQDLESVFGTTSSYDAISTSVATDRIEVSVTHGDLSFTRNPVAVGHYVGDSLIGAEKALDWCLGSALSESRYLGIYPGAAGTEKYFRNQSEQLPPGALVIGLGAVGRLSPGLLRNAFLKAILIYVTSLREKSEHKKPIRLSTLLIGSGAGGLSIKESMHSILRAVDDANARLKSQLHSGSYRLSAIEFIEIQQDNAIEALHALKKIKQLDQSVDKNFSIRMSLNQGEAARVRAHRDNDYEWWRRLEIRQHNSCGGLVFTALTDTSRAVVQMQPTQIPLIDKFVSDSITTSRWLKEDSSTLFDLLIPRSLKEYSIDEKNLVLIVDKYSARFPWELLHDRTQKDREPLGVRTGLLRQLATSSGDLKPNYTTDNTIIVIGNPKLDDWQNFADLPGAKLEANRVIQLFGSKRYEVHSSIEKGPKHVINTFFSDNCKVLHLAGHGVLQNEGSDKEIAGMVLGDGVYLTANEILQMRQVPELVFVNCCHLGKIDQESEALRSHNKLAASIAVSLIERGVKAVVAAGWAVDDAVAVEFAEQFYTQMLSGFTFGEAVISARSATYKSKSEYNTWGAYQCYGDPSYRLERREQYKGTSKKEYVARAEVVVDLKNIVSSAKKAKGSNEGFASTINEIELAAAEWKNEAVVLEALGFANGEIQRYAKAVENLEKAINADSGEASLRAAEQLANFKCRLAVEVHGLSRLERLKLKLHTSTKLVNDSIGELEQLVSTYGQSTERVSLLAASYKRKTQITNRGKATALKQLAKYYKLASDIAERKNGEIDTYPALNWVVAELVLHWTNKAVTVDLDDVKKQLDRIEVIANVKSERAGSDFWTLVVVADTQVAKTLLPLVNKGKNSKKNNTDSYDSAVSIVKSYTAAHGSVREFASVKENLAYIISMLEDGNSLRSGANDAKLRVKHILELLHQQIK